MAESESHCKCNHGQTCLYRDELNCHENEYESNKNKDNELDE